MKLTDKFDQKDLSWRIGQAGMKDGKPWARVLVYVTARAVMDRLDEVVGSSNWQDSYTVVPVLKKISKSGNAEAEETQYMYECKLSIYSKEIGQWITKTDIAEGSNIESVKGGYSDAFKRSAVKFGIGRYLYEIKDCWAVFTDNGQYSSKIDNRWFKWNPPAIK